MSRISVVIPCHNAEPYLAETLRSVLRQSRRAEEIIVVDDASDDRSVAIARSFGSVIRLARVNFHHGSKSRNHGAELASGDRLLFLDADDVLGPDALAGLDRALADATDAVALCSWFRLEFINESWEQRPPSWPSGRLAEDILNGWLRGRYFPPCSVLWCRDAYEATGGWDPDLVSNQDGDLIFRHLGQGLPVRRASEGFSFYRRVPGSVSSDRNKRTAIESRLAVLERLVRILRTGGRLESYQLNLSHAFLELASDAGPKYHDLASLAELRAQELRPPAPRRVFLEASARIEDRIRRSLSRFRPL